MLYRGYKLWISCKVISYSQSIHGFRQSNRDCSVIPPNWRNILYWPSEWVSYDECTSIYGYTLDKTYGDHDIRLSIIMIYQVTMLHGLSTIKGILNMCQNQHEALTNGWDPKMVIYSYGLDYY